jgi:GMP synthase (glutamine-hydrolysing)
MSRRLMAIRHVCFEDLGSFEALLRNADFKITYVDAPQADFEEIDPLAPDVLVVLGGPISVYDERTYPFLREELRLLEERAVARLPTLGICLGAQLFVRALGARVYAGSRREIGWGALTLTEAGQASPMIHLGGEHTRVLHWHGDTFDLPNGATLLASTALYTHQAFVWEKCLLGMQFHPEITARGLEAWYVGHAVELAAAGVSIERLRIEGAQYASTLEAYAEMFLHGWLREVGL